MFHCLSDVCLYGPHILIRTGVSNIVILVEVRRLPLLISPVRWRKIEKACVKIGGFQVISKFDKICNFDMFGLCVNFETQRPQSS